jgi:hypothetical protein
VASSELSIWQPWQPSEPSDSKIWSWVLWDLELRITVPSPHLYQGTTISQQLQIWPGLFPQNTLTVGFSSQYITSWQAPQRTLFPTVLLLLHVHTHCQGDNVYQSIASEWPSLLAPQFWLWALMPQYVSRIFHLSICYVTCKESVIRTEVKACFWTVYWVSVRVPLMQPTNACNQWTPFPIHAGE